MAGALTLKRVVNMNKYFWEAWESQTRAFVDNRFHDDKELQKRVRQEVRETEQYGVLRQKFEAWGFSPSVDAYIQNLIDESGYWVSTQQKEGAWTVEVKPKNDGKFDSAQVQKALDAIDSRRRMGMWGLYCENRDVLTLADQLYSAAKTSLEKHGDLRDAVKEMGDYRLRDQSHPNASERDDLRRALFLFISARMQYEEDFDPGFAGTVDDEIWFDERIKHFQNVAAEYVDIPNAHARWLTSEIAAWLLRPYNDMLSRGATRSFPASRIGSKWKRPWCIVVPLCISCLLFLLSVALVIGCYLLFTPQAAYVAAGLCVLIYVRRYLQDREFRKERKKLVRLWQKVSYLCNEVKSGEYNVGEVIRRFREIEADDVYLPSIFVSVIALSEAKPAPQVATLA
jgi:hypothetical protein